MDLIQMLALSQIQELERDMRARQQRHELAEARHDRSAVRRLRDRIATFARTTSTRPTAASPCGAAGAAC